MDRILHFKKGDTCIVAIEPCSNASRRTDMSINNIANWTYEGEVITVSKKYITVKFNYETAKFEVDNDYRKKVSCGSNDHKLYASIDEVYTERKKKELISAIFGYNSITLPEKISNLTLEQVERIETIINENTSIN